MHQTTGVAIIGAGPAGLLLGHILGQAGVPFMILERSSREHVLGRIRAGVLEQGSVDILAELGLDARLRERGLTHHGIYLQFERAAAPRRLPGARRPHRHGLRAAGARAPTCSPSTSASARASCSRPTTSSPSASPASDPRSSTRRTARCTSSSATSSSAPTATTASAASECPAGDLQVFERSYPFGWLGILADVPPSTDDLIYALHPDGFAMHSMRSLEVSRLYVQVGPRRVDRRLERRPHLGRAADPPRRRRLGRCRRAPITEKSITPMRSFVVSTMSSGRHVPRRRRRPHRAAHRREGPQLGDRRRRDARPRHPRPPRRRLDRPRPVQRPGARAAVEGAALLAVDDRDAARAPRGSGCLGARLPLPQPGRPARVRHRLDARACAASPSSTPASRSDASDRCASDRTSRAPTSAAGRRSSGRDRRTAPRGA